MTRNTSPTRTTAQRIAMIFVVLALLLTLLPVAPAAAAGGGATPGLAKYNAYVVQLHNVGCTPLWVSWGSSYWKCPPNQRWVAKYYEATDTATLRRLR